MSTPEESPEPEATPEEIPEPPVLLPIPDRFDKDEPEKIPKKEKQRHPTDSYQPLKERKGGLGRCCGCLAIVAVVALLTIGGVLYWQFKTVIGYEKVFLSGDQTLLSEAPAKPTWYFGKKIIYAAPPTKVEICLTAVEIQITGDFLENVSLMAGKVVAEKGAHFAKNLEVRADTFVDKGITLKGKLTGRVQNSQ